jgi:hypothetical protein
MNPVQNVSNPGCKSGFELQQMLGPLNAQAIVATTVDE